MLGVGHSNKKNLSLTKNMKKILIIGSGAMGAAFSIPLIENNQFQGKDIPIMAKIIDKLQKESAKLMKETQKAN